MLVLVHLIIPRFVTRISLSQSILFNFTQIHVGGDSGVGYVCGIRTGGLLFCWGSNLNGLVCVCVCVCVCGVCVCVCVCVCVFVLHC
jgi:hypothetical protein